MIDREEMLPAFQGRLEMWEESRKDPNNWMEIPEFGVQPEAVNFEGFALPIIGPIDEAFGFRRDIRDMVGLARCHAKTIFGSQRKLLEVNAEAWAIEGAWMYEDDADPPWDEGQWGAVSYWMSMSCFKEAVSPKTYIKSPLMRAIHAANYVAEGASLLARFLVDQPFVMDRETVKRIKDGAISGGINSGKARRQKSIIPTPDVLRTRRSELLASGKSERDVASILAKRYGCSPDHIRKTLKRD